MRISAALPHGVSALFAGSARRRRRLEAELVEHLESAGFDEVVLPIVDYLEPYEPLLTPASRRELYQFVDRDGELLALRADFTPMLARLIAPRLRSLEIPLAVFYRGDVVRFQEERAGRLRELYQVGAELLGVPGAEGEERMLRLFLEILDRMAAAADRRVDVVLGLAGALDGLLERAAASPTAGPGGPGAIAELASALARRDRDTLRRAGSHRGRDSGGDVLLTIAERGVPEDPEDLGRAAPRLERLLALRDRLAGGTPTVRLTVDLAEFATQTLLPPGSSPIPATTDSEDAPWGRSYYDGVVFRAYLGAGALPVGGGGRYDRLYRTLGAEVPAVGFSVGLDRLGEGLGPRGRSGEADRDG